MNSTDLIHLIKHFMRNEYKAVEEVIDSPLSEVANLIKVLQSCQGKVVFIGTPWCSSPPPCSSHCGRRSSPTGWAHRVV